MILAIEILACFGFVVFTGVLAGISKELFREREFMLAFSYLGMAFFMAAATVAIFWAFELFRGVTW